MTFSRRRLLRGALATAALGAAGVTWRSCSRGSAQRVAASPGTLRRGNGAEPESLDLHAARSEPALTLLRDLYEGLLELDGDGTPRSALAQHHEMTDDGCRYRFELRRDARWSSGDRVVAEDVAAAWRRLVDPLTGAQYAGLLAPVRGATAIAAGVAAPSTLGVTATDDATLLVDLEHPAPYFASVLAHPATFPLHRPSLAALGRRFAKPGRLVSNGAFRLTRWDFGSHLVAERNASYWNVANCQFGRVEYYSFADSGAELRAFRAGALDTTNSIPPAQYDWLRQHVPEQLRISPQLAVYYLGFNMHRAPLGNSPALRRALAMVIDRERLVESVTATGERPAYSFVPPQIPGYSPALPDYATWPMSRRIEAARRLLREAGHESAPPPLEIRYNSSELHSRIALAVAQMWKTALDIDTVLRAEEYKALLQDIEDGDSVQIFRGSWVADYPDATSFLNVLQSGLRLNLPRYANARYDALLAQAAAVAGTQERAGLLRQAEAAMLAEQPLIPLYFYVAKHLVSPRIHGWPSNAMNVVYAKNLSTAERRV